jgi:hypothetical protein
MVVVIVVLVMVCDPLAAFAQWGEPITSASERFIVLSSFNNEAVGQFWSATTFAGDSTLAESWSIPVSAYGAFPKASQFKVWCVRSSVPGFVGH